MSVRFWTHLFHILKSYGGSRVWTTLASIGNWSTLSDIVVECRLSRPQGRTGLVGMIVVVQIVGDHVAPNPNIEWELITIYRTPQIERYRISEKQEPKHLAIVQVNPLDDVVQYFLEQLRISRRPSVGCFEGWHTEVHNDCLCEGSAWPLVAISRFREMVLRLYADHEYYKDKYVAVRSNRCGPVGLYSTLVHRLQMSLRLGSNSLNAQQSQHTGKVVQAIVSLAAKRR